MSETQTDARNAVVYIDDQPCLDLAADVFTYPVDTPDEQFTLMVSMRAYKPYPVKKFYDQCIPKRKQRSSVERAIEAPDYTDLRAFVLDHFLSFEGAELEDGSEPTIEQQRQWLKENPVFLERIFRNGIEKVGAPGKAEPSGESGKAVLLFGQREHHIPLEIGLYSPETGTRETLRFTAHLERLSQSQKHQYDKAISVIENSRRNELYQENNWDVIEQIANQALKRLDGAVVIDGEPCAEANKENWIARLPLLMKVYALAQAIQEIDIKNA